jgi:hypothetical protein
MIRLVTVQLLEVVRILRDNDQPVAPGVGEVLRVGTPEQVRVGRCLHMVLVRVSAEKADQLLAVGALIEV